VIFIQYILICFGEEKAKGDMKRQEPICFCVVIIAKDNLIKTLKAQSFLYECLKNMIAGILSDIIICPLST